LTVITNSEIRTRRRCPREHYFAYVLGYRSCEEADALRLGTIWHLALEAWWTGQGLEAAIAIATAHAFDLYEAAKLRVMLRGYDARWGHESYEVLGVEEVFTAPLVNPVTGAPSRTYALGGKLDLRFTRDFMEHKTTSEDIGLGSIYRRKLTIDTQVSTYYAGARSLGTEPERCHYDVVRKPALRPKQLPQVDAEGVKIVVDANGERVRTKDQKKWRETADTAQGYVALTREETPAEFEARLVEEVASDPERYYQRFDVIRLAEEEAEAALDAWQVAQGMREDMRLNRHPRNPDACERFGRMCDFFDVCTGVSTLEDNARYVRLDNVHPELAPPHAEAAE
jgi:hypothetical protein